MEGMPGRAETAGDAQPRIVVLGCGISGLVAARTLSGQGALVTLIEPYALPGGNHISVEVEGMVFDIGAIHFNDDDLVFDAFPELKARCLERVIGAQKLSADGRVRHYPMEASDLLDQTLGFRIATVLSLVRGRLKWGRVETAADFVERRLGKFFFEQSGLRHYVSRLFGCDASEIDAEFGERRLGWLARRSSLRGALLGAATRLRRGAKPPAAPVTSLVRPAEGFGAYYAGAVEALRRDGVDVRLGADLRRISRLEGAREGAGMTVETGDGAIVADRVVSTLPIRLALSLCGLPAPNLGAVDLLSLFVAFRGRRGFAASVLFNFNAIGEWKRLTVLSDLYGEREGEAYFTVEIPLRDPALSAETAFARFRADVEGAGLFEGALRLVGNHRLGEAYPLLDRGCTARRAEAVARLEAAGVEGIGRQGRFEYIPHQDVAAREAIALLARPRAAPVPFPSPYLPSRPLSSPPRPSFPLPGSMRT